MTSKPEYISVCKNAIVSNNKRNWQNPDPAIRVAKSKTGKANKRAHVLSIKDANGNEVARIISSQDGKPLIKAGAKVVIKTKYATEVIE